MKSTAKRSFLACVAGLTLAVAARADDVYIKSSPTAAELKLSNVTVRKVADGELHFSVNANERHRPVAELRLDLTGETAFNAAEKAFSDARANKDETAAKAQYASAVNGYSTTLASTNKPWLKDFAALRMSVAAPKSGRFDTALDAWRSMVEKDPAGASKSKPSFEGIDPKSQYLVAGVKALQVAANGSPKPDARRAYLEMLGDIQTYMGDIEGANKTLEMRVNSGGTPEEIADVGIKLALNDLANKKLDAAAERVGKLNMAALPDTNRAEAIFILAEAKAAKMAPTAPADEWKDLALDYMRVVVGSPSSPNAATAMLKVGQIHETLKEPETAVKIYQQVARDYASTPAGQVAVKNVERLGKGAR